MRNGLLLCVLAVIAFLSACTSGKKAYERGDYYEAVMLSIGRLRQNPNHSKSAEALRNAYPLAVEWYETDAKNQIASNSTSKYKNALVSYGRINNMYEAIKQAPGALAVVSNPKNYYSEIGPLKEKAAEELYNQGIASLMKGNRNDAKRAFFQFKEAQSYVNDYKDVLDYINKSKFEATVFVIVDQVAVPGRYNLSGGFFQDKVEEYLHRNYPDEGFVKFYTPKEAQTIRLQRVDQYLRLQFDDFSVGNVSMKEYNETITKDSVLLGYASVPGSTTITQEVTTNTTSNNTTTKTNVTNPNQNQQGQKPGESLTDNNKGTGDDKKNVASNTSTTTTTTTTAAAANGKYPVYGTVKAKLTLFRKEVISNGLLSMIVVDGKTNGVLKHEKFSDTYVWVSEWGHFNGDERALGEQQLAACNRREVPPPDNQQLFLEFAGPIYNKMIPVINGFYKQY